MRWELQNTIIEMLNLDNILKYGIDMIPKGGMSKGRLCMNLVCAPKIKKLKNPFILKMDAKFYG